MSRRGSRSGDRAADPEPARAAATISPAASGGTIRVEPGGPAIVWFQRDLRLADNAALRAARDRGLPVVPVYIRDTEGGAWPPGAASRYWLHQSLRALSDTLRRAGSPLILRSGPAQRVLPALARETGAVAVLWNRIPEPDRAAREAEVAAALADQGTAARAFDGALLHDPRAIRTASGGPFQVFTPFYRAFLRQTDPGPPLPAVAALAAPAGAPVSERLEDWELEPRIDWAGGIRESWTFGEAGARRSLRGFLEGVEAYPSDRDRPGVDGTSRLSPHLHFGEISPRQLWHEASRAAAGTRRHGVSGGTEAWQRQLVWREFAHHLLAAFPKTSLEPLRAEFARFPWRRDTRGLRAWQRGRTGYPVVDAGMRQLWAEGWMHNRVRMIVASFLVKDLLLPWQEGARWFWDTLVDADLANNTLGWQWVAGCGADAAPYFRVFNPGLQGAKFDPDGAYIRRWIPELAALPDRWIHRPWDAPAPVLRDAGVRIGEGGGSGNDYPAPIVDHAMARDRALAAYAAVRGRTP